MTVLHEPVRDTARADWIAGVARNLLFVRDATIWRAIWRSCTGAERLRRGSRTLEFRRSSRFWSSASSATASGAIGSDGVVLRRLWNVRVARCCGDKAA
jgi:hypothetical protein